MAEVVPAWATPGETGHPTHLCPSKGLLPALQQSLHAARLQGPGRYTAQVLLAQEAGAQYREKGLAQTCIQVHFLVAE